MPPVAEAIGHASPVLAQRIAHLIVAGGGLRETYRATLATMRYVRRMAGRATPLGLLAGVAIVDFGSATQVRWGTDHHVLASPAAWWLEATICALESSRDVLAHLLVATNDAAFVRGSYLVVPSQPQGTGRIHEVDAVVAHTAAVRFALGTADTPIRTADLAAKMLAWRPSAGLDKVMAFLAILVHHRALLTNLRPPATCTDPLHHVLTTLHTADANAIPAVCDRLAALAGTAARLRVHSGSMADSNRRRDTAEWMGHTATAERHPLALDLRLDATIQIPAAVAREAERAALALVRLSAYPNGRPAWRSYHMRFYERYGLGAMVPLLEVIDPDCGIGWPDGYPGTEKSETPTPHAARNDALLAIAQAAALDACREVVVDEQMIDALRIGGDPPRLPPHLELAMRVHAPDAAALDRGDFLIEVTSVARSAGPLSGRFLRVLTDADRARLQGQLADLPTGDADTVAAQLSFPPLDPADAHVARSPRILPLVISLGEYPDPQPGVLTVADLAVGCDGTRMFLAAPGLGWRVEAVTMHALNPVQHTPPLARFLLELSRAHYAQTTTFDWGAATVLPYLPRLRYGRAILSPATWHLTAAELPKGDWHPWDEAFTAWRERRRLSQHVLLTQGDQRLPLDLAQTAHRVLLRDHMTKARTAVLTEAPEPGSAGWCDDRTHELVVPLKATSAPTWPTLPRPTTARITGRGQGHTPATSRVLMVKLYGARARQDELLTEHLPTLLAAFDTTPPWWIVRFRDPDPHLRLRLALPDPRGVRDGRGHRQRLGRRAAPSRATARTAIQHLLSRVRPMGGRARLGRRRGRVPRRLRRRAGPAAPRRPRVPARPHRRQHHRDRGGVHRRPRHRHGLADRQHHCRPRPAASSGPC